MELNRLFLQAVAIWACTLCFFTTASAQTFEWAKKSRRNFWFAK
jgi:hypothetical protein